MRVKFEGLGDCSKCSKSMKPEEAVKVWQPFTEPIPAMPEFGIEECIGVYVFMHAECQAKGR